MVAIKHCCYRGCRNNSRDLDPSVVQGATFYPFPKPKTKLEKRKKWIRAIGREDLNNVDKIRKFHYVCNYHFVGAMGPTDANPDPIPYGASLNEAGTVSRDFLGNEPTEDKDVHDNQVVDQAEVTECDVSMSNMKKETIKIVLRINEQKEEIERLDEEIERLKGIIGKLKNEVEDLTEKNGMNRNYDYAIAGPVEYEPESYGQVLSLPFLIQQQPQEEIESLQSIPTELISNISHSLLEKEVVDHNELGTFQESGFTESNNSSEDERYIEHHARMRVREKRFKCDQCAYATERKSKLIQHKRIHSDEKPFKCDLCHYACKQKNNLIQHLRIHSGEKCFKCDQCDYATTHKSSLNRHQRIHSGEKHFKCDQCDFGCTDKSNLISHRRIHSDEKPFKCDHCDYAGRWKIDFIRHQHKHSGEKPFKCDQCDYASTKKTYLLKHQLKHSGVNMS